MLKLASLLLALGIVATPAHAITYAEWALLSENTRNAFLAGMSDGMGWVNVAVQQDHGVAAFCPPQALGLSPAQYIALLNDYVGRTAMAAPENQEVGILLLSALEEAFPC
jgi:hypothetical protein